MLETIREYAQERFEESEEVSRLHAEYFVALAEKAEPVLWGVEDAAWFQRLETEHGNLRAALSWSLGGADVELGLRLAGALGEFWYARGTTKTGRGGLRRR
jgi:predicted ATPase